MAAFSRRGSIVLLLAGTVSTQWRHSGGLADAVRLSYSPPYCAKQMDVNSIPPLDHSVKQSFGDDITIGDVELMQVRACCSRSGAFFLPGKLATGGLSCAPMARLSARVPFRCGAAARTEEAECSSIGKARTSVTHQAAGSRIGGG